MADTLYRELLWIAQHAGIRPGWAYYRYKEITGKDPERGSKITFRPSEDTLQHARGHINPTAFGKVLKVWADRKLAKERKDSREVAKLSRELEDLRNASKIKSQVYRELDLNRPPWEDL